MLGTTIDGKYRIVRLVGQGGMGVVYEAVHTGTGRRVALKLITGSQLGMSQDAIARFQREVRAAGAIESQHIAQVLDTGVDRELGAQFMVMEFLDGQDLQQLTDKLGALPQSVALRIIAQACSGLQKAHEAGVVHRDIKPANLFLSRRDDGDLVVRLLDFGIAKVKMDQMLGGGDQGFTRTGSMLGSPMYMSPEQAMGLKTVDHRTDIWSVGAVLYEILCGRNPHAGKDTLGQLIMTICSAPPPPIQSMAPWVRPELAQIVHRALRLDPEERFQSAAEMREAIRQLVPGFTLSDGMVVSLPADERQHTAALQPGAHAPQVPAIAPNLTHVPAGSTPAGAITADPSFSSTRREAPPRGSGPLLPVALGVTALALVGFGAWFHAHRASNAPPAASASAVQITPLTTTAPSVVPETSAPSVVPNTSAPSVTPSSAPDLLTPHTVRLQISPVSAKVEIDGAPAQATDGVVVLEGAVGSAHKVRVSAWGREATETVSIREDGPVPARVELSGGAPAAGPGPAAHLHAPPGTAATASPPPASTKPTSVKPAGPTLDKQFE